MAKGTKTSKGTKYVSGKVDLIFPAIATPQYYVANSNKFVTIQKEDQLEKECTKNDKGVWVKQVDDKDVDLGYVVTVLVPKDSNEGKKIKHIIDTEWENGKKAGMISKRSLYPLVDGDEKADELESRDKNGEYYRGCYSLQAKTKYKPLIIEGKKRVNPTSTIFDVDHNGWTGRVSLTIRPYKFGANSGVSIKLNQICFLEDNPDLDFGGGCDFEIEEEDEQTDFGNNVANNETVNTGIQSCYDEEEEPPVM